MGQWTAERIKGLLKSFEDKSLSHEAWTHEAHLVVACHYLYTYSDWEALIFLRSGIITLNRAQKVENSPSSGYHETLTCFWVKTISYFMNKHKEGKSLEEVCQLFLKSPFANTRIALEFYSKDHLFTVEARASWVEPDIKPFNFDKLF
ncbi:MAG: hypothetical protein AAF696_10805 [Bacteroidota bacterium]